MNPALIKQMLAIVKEGSVDHRIAKLLHSAGVTSGVFHDNYRKSFPESFSLDMYYHLRDLEMGAPLSSNQIGAGHLEDALKRMLRAPVVPKPPRE